MLRLGADRDTVTLLHYAEYLTTIDKKRRTTHRVELAGGRWTTISCLDDSKGIRDWPHGRDYFEQILNDFLSLQKGRLGTVGLAQAELLDGREFVRFGVQWMEENL